MRTNILIIGDTHIPFVYKKYLDFCLDAQKKYKCGLVIHIGDLVDFHSISRFEHDPDGFSPYAEHQESLKILKKWYKAFPKCTLLIGNHDERLERAAVGFGLSQAYFKSYRDIWQLPKGWAYEFETYRYGVRFFHGMGYSGKHAHYNAATEHDCSVVMGHLHSNAGTAYVANEGQIKFGLAVGCGIDRHTYAFRYGRDMRRKPILGCGVVLDSGRDALFVPMQL